MIKKSISLIFLIFFLTSCGFTPLYQNNTNINYSIEQVDYSGDRELNNFLKSNLNKYKNEKIDKKIFIEVNSIYKKNILTKDGTGKITSYELEAVVIFLIQPLNKEIQIIEKKIMNSMDDKFEETRQERIIKQSFVSSISNKLISEISIN
jgi:PBP1b-binding outer membrane lipoprotein LpoB